MSYSSYIFIGPQKTGSSFHSSLRSIHVVSRIKETFILIGLFGKCRFL